MVPLGAMNESGLWTTFYSNAIWQAGLHGDIYGAKLNYAGCHGAGCVAEIKVTPELISILQISGGFEISAIGSSARTVFAVPLAGFAEALAGPPLGASRHQPSQAERQLICASAKWASAEWSGCSTKPIHEWGR
jgi:Invasion associated locus B (IalB) protein